VIPVQDETSQRSLAFFVMGKVSGYPLNIDPGYDDTIERNCYTKNWMKKALQ
jgi:hypothetical protein